MVKLEGEGLLAREIGFADLRALARQVEHASELFRGATVGAVPLASVLKLVTPPGSARSVTFHAADGYSTTLPLEVAAMALLVYRLGDEPLPAERGGPVRLIVLGADLRSCLKHVARIELTAAGRDDRLPACSHAPRRAA
jgi:DMSO/TMAO reductase YedYZ molybdopterin-dependent catalytic subunit